MKHEPEIIHVETWYEVEVSARGANDWYATCERADTMEGLKVKLRRGKPFQAGFDVRYIKKTITVELAQ